MVKRSVFSKYLVMPKDSPEHRQFREDLWIGCASIACQYYLSTRLSRNGIDTKS